MEAATKRNDVMCGIPLKWFSLVLMVAQTVGMTFLLRLSRINHVVGPRYLNTTAIFFSEALKFGASLGMHWWTSKDFAQFRGELWKHTVGQPWDLLKMAVPSLLYAVQNNLLFIGISLLPASIYQVTSQVKILTTAFLSVLILGTKLDKGKWVGLLLLFMGVVIVEKSGHQAHQAASPTSLDSGSMVSSWSHSKGIIAVIAACVISGFASVFLEKMLKQASTSLWIRNVQLSAFGAPFALAIALHCDANAIRQDGFMQGYSMLVWVVVAMQAFSGLTVAAVMKYADNILKCFGSATAIIFTCALSVLVLHEFTPDLEFGLGTFLVLSAISVYTLGLPTASWESETLPLLGGAAMKNMYGHELGRMGTSWLPRATLKVPTTAELHMGTVG